MFLVYTLSRIQKYKENNLQQKCLFERGPKLGKSRMENKFWSTNVEVFYSVKLVL